MDFDWRKYDAGQSSYLDIIAEGLLEQRMSKKLLHFGMNRRYYWEENNRAEFLHRLLSKTPKWFSIMHWIDAKYELGHIVAQTLFDELSNEQQLIQGQMSNDPSNFFMQLPR